MTLRARVLLALGLIAFMVVATPIVTTRIARDRLIAEVDDRLVAAVPLGRGGNDRGPRQDDQFRFNPYYVGVVVDGELVDRLIPNLSGDDSSPPDLDVSDPATLAALAAPNQPFTVAARDGTFDYRVVIRAERRSGVQLVVGAPLDQVAASANDIARIAWIIALCVLAALVFVAWWVLRLGVRPVQRISEAAANIDDGDLGRRVPVSAPDTEVGQLAVTLNSMLDRIETGFAERAETEARLRRFVADASHELRTPLQTIRGYAELYRMGGLVEGNKLDDAMHRTEAEASRMGALVDELLTLARFDQARELHLGPVDLAALCRDAVADARVVQPSRTIECSADEPIAIEGDEHLLQRVIANVIGNALIHTPVASRLAIVVSADAANATIAVRDEGPGMASDAAGRAFERFFRADASRSRAVGSSGLGLAIVESAVVAHGGTVELDSSVESGTTVTITLPRRSNGT